MTAGSTIVEVQHPPKEPTFSSSRILSKIARSPTANRKHRPVPSGGSGSDSTSISSDPNSRPPTQGASHSRLNAPRPSFQRQISAPDTSVFLKEEVEGPRHFSDATGQVAQQAKAMLHKQPSSAGTMSPPKSSTPVGERASSNMYTVPLLSEHYADHRPSTGTQQGATHYMFQQLQELSNKRIATLVYMRKA